MNKRRVYYNHQVKEMGPKIGNWFLDDDSAEKTGLKFGQGDEAAVIALASLTPKSYFDDRHEIKSLDLFTRCQFFQDKFRF